MQAEITIEFWPNRPCPLLPWDCQGTYLLASSRKTEVRDVPKARVSPDFFANPDREIALLGGNASFVPGWIPGFILNRIGNHFCTVYMQNFAGKLARKHDFQPIASLL